MIFRFVMSGCTPGASSGQGYDQFQREEGVEGDKREGDL